MSMTDLKRCPFCGGQAYLHECDWCEPSEFNAGCHRCGASTGGCTDRALAISSWNRRALLAEAPVCHPIADKLRRWLPPAGVQLERADYDLFIEAADALDASPRPLSIQR